MEGLNETTKQCVAAYGSLLDKLSISVKMELYKAIYSHPEAMTEDVLRETFNQALDYLA